MTTDGIPELHEVVLGALELHSSSHLPELHFGTARKRLVIASGNALPTGRILFSDEDALFCDEGQYLAAIQRHPDIDSTVVISASGTKHAPIILADLMQRNFTPYLLTCAKDSPAAKMVPEDRVFVTPSVPEPITYNTSTYLGMVLAKTREDPAAIRDFLLQTVAPSIPDLRLYQAYYYMVSPEFETLLPMYLTKFDELFGGRLNGRCYTTEQTMHAKTVVPWDLELFVTIGTENEDYGRERLTIPVPKGFGFAAMIAIGYYTVGHIQSQNPPWFKEHAAEYKVIQNKLFEKYNKA